MNMRSSRKAEREAYMNTINNNEAQPTMSMFSQQQADLAKPGVITGSVIMVAGAVTSKLPLAVAGGALIAASLWLYSMATDNKTSVKLAVSDLVKLKLERERNSCTSG